MRRVIPVLAALLLSSVGTTLPVEASTAECAKDGDKCIVRVTSAAQQQWLVRVQNFSSGSTITCRVAGDCAFEVPYKSTVQILVASSLPFSWEDSSQSISGASGWVKGIPMPADVLGPKSGDATGKFVVDSNVSFAVTSKSPISLAQSTFGGGEETESVLISTSLGLLGPSMSSALTGATNGSFADWFGSCAAGSSVLGRDFDVNAFTLLLNFDDASGNRVFSIPVGVGSSPLKYGTSPADSPFTGDRSITGRVKIDNSRFVDRVLTVSASVQSESGTCSSGPALTALTKLVSLTDPPIIPDQILPPVASVNYAHQLVAQGIQSKPRWSIVTPKALPDGVKLSESGVLTVGPGFVGNYRFSAVVQDGNGAKSEPRQLRLTGYAVGPNPDDVRDLLLKRGCSTGGERCLAVVQMMGRRAANLVARDRCELATLCVGAYGVADAMKIVAEVNRYEFGRAEVTLYPRGGGTPITRTLNPNPVVGSDIWSVVYSGRASFDAIVRVWDKPKFYVRSAPLEQSVSLSGFMSGIRDNMTVADTAADARVRAFCERGVAQPMAAVSTPDGARPQLLAMLSRDADFAKPFAVVPMALSKLGLQDNEQSFVWIDMSNQPAGPFHVRFALLDAAGNVACATARGQQVTDDYPAVVSQAAFNLTGRTESAGLLGGPYRQTVTVAGGTAPFRFELASGELPRGLGLETSTGTIAGTLAQAGDFPFVMRVIDANNRSALSNRMVISAQWRVLSTVPARFTAGSPVNGLRVTAVEWERSVQDPTFIQNGTAKIAYSVTGLPKGLNLDAATGVVSGTTTESGEFSAVFTAVLTIGSVVVSQQQVVVQSVVEPQTPAVTQVTGIPQTTDGNVPTMTSLRKRPAPVDPSLTQLVVPRPVEVAKSGSTDAQAVLETAVAPPTQAVQPPTAVVAPTTTGGTATSDSSTAVTPATRTLRLTFANNKATASAAARAAFVAAVKSFGKASTITISSPAVAAKNGKSTPTTQAVAFLRTQVVKNQLKAAGATATVTTRVVVSKRPSATVTVTLKR